MLSCSIRFCAPSFWMGGGLESRCVGRVYGADGSVLAYFMNINPLGVPQIHTHTLSARASYACV